MRLPRLSLALIILAAVAVPAAAQDIPRPPAVLSPDLTAPWVVQFNAVQVAALPRATYNPTANQVPAERGPWSSIDPQFLPQIVDYSGPEAPGTIIIDTEARFLYLVEPGYKARRYGVGVGRPGFEWAGVHTVTRKAEWPNWYPPAEMRARQPELPDMMVGGIDNPLGARALYLGETLYRIHGSNQPWTIGYAVSSGCIRMRNEDVIDLYNRVPVGTRVIVI